MKVKINNITYKIKPASELNISEYVKIFEGLDSKNNLEVLIRYIAVTTGNIYKDVANIDMNQKTISRLFAYIGKASLATEIPENKEFYHKKSGKTLYQKSVDWQTLGVRKLFEDRKAESQIEQAVYLLAVYLSNDYDSEKIEEIYIELQDYNAIDVLSFIIFFFKKLHHGKNSGSNFFQRLRKKVSTNTPKQLSK